MAPLMQSCHFFSRYGVTLTVLFALTGIGAELFSISFTKAFEVSKAWEISFISMFSVALFEPVSTGAAIYFIASRNDREPLNVYDCVMKSWHPYSRLVVCYFMVTGLVLLGFSLYLLPGIYLLYKLLFVEYLIVLQGKSPGEAMVESFFQTNGQSQLVLPSFCLLIGLFLVGSWGIDAAVISLGESDFVRIMGVFIKAPLVAFAVVVGFRLYDLSLRASLKPGV